ncbi:hypothetical protein B0H14DRAFT_2613352 [Mycena olivaceomarginata]|nr:hypothetical protein B0H14DRAFT_2613352 [Mycena olivaceomarginata]
MPIELVGHDLVTEAAKPPFLNKGPPACTNCISRGHDCQPCNTGRTNRCQCCHDGHMVCSCGRTALELLTSFKRLRSVLTVSPSVLNTALISLVTACPQLTRMLAQYDQQLQEVVDIIIQQNNTFDTAYVQLFYEDPEDREVLQGLLKCTLQYSSPEDCHRDWYVWHPVTPVVHNPKLSPDQATNSHTRLVPFEDPHISDIDTLPNFCTVVPILQQAPGSVPDTPSHLKAVQLTQETALQAFAKPSTAAPSVSSSLVAGPSTTPLIPSPGHTLVDPAVPPSTSAAMEQVEDGGL